MVAVPHTEIEQWAVLRAVVEAGSFARAATALNRSQSAVSYAVARLQERLGVALLEIDGRRAILTDAGRMLLAEAAPIIDDLVRLERRGRLIAEGQEARIRLLVDAIFPKSILFGALASFQAAHPHTEIVLHEVVRSLPPDLQGEPFDLAVTLWDRRMGLAERLVEIEMIALAHPGHPLHSRGARLSMAALARHPGLVIEGEVPAMSAPAIAGDGPEWRVNTVEAAVEAVRHGLCHGWLPRHLVEDDIRTGRLRPLPLAAGATRAIPLILSYADEETAGPLTRAMAALLIERCGH